MNNNILVTGGAGFIGSHFIKYIMRQYSEFNIINLDLLTYAANLNNLDSIEKNFRYKFIKGDIGDKELINYILEKYSISCIVNFAAESHVDNSIKDSEIFVKTNIVGTYTLIQAAKEYWQVSNDENGYPLYRDGTKFIQISTDEVYGSIEDGSFATEKSSLSPSNPYSSTKASADLLLLSYFRTYKFPMNIIRACNNYGPNQFVEKFIPKTIYSILLDKKLPLYGTGNQVRDWIFVEDNCRAINEVLFKGRLGEIYNVSSRNQMKNIDLLYYISEKLFRNSDFFFFENDRLGHDYRYAVSNRKIVSELGWEPMYSFDYGMNKTLEYYLDFFKKGKVYYD